LILLDTHVIVWLASDDPRLSKAATSAIAGERKAERGLAISDFTLYELAMLFRKKQIALSATIESFLSEVETHFVSLPLTAGICVRALGFPAAYPRVPADRIIGATALEEGLSLVTADTEIRDSRAVPTIW